MTSDYARKSLCAVLGLAIVTWSPESVRIPGDVNGAFRQNVNKDSGDVNEDSDGK